MIRSSARLERRAGERRRARRRTHLAAVPPRRRRTTTEQVESPIKGANVIQLERRGDVYIMSVAKYGDTLSSVQTTNVSLGDDVYVGLFICAHNDTVTERATLTDVRITVPAKATFVPYRDYIGSNVEILEVATGHRRIVHHADNSMQAPNWTRDGKALIYNQNGKLYRFDLATGTPTEINTGERIRNNNDHVISFDGKHARHQRSDAPRAASRSCTRCPSREARRCASRRSRRRTCTAGRPTASISSTPASAGRRRTSTASR